jgi:hypothetical protein
MAATHRFSGSRLDLHTSLAPEQVAGISKRVGDGTKGNIRIGVNHVRFEGASPGRTVFSIRALGDAWELMVFHVAITADGADSSVRTGIDSFKTAQSAEKDVWDHPDWSEEPVRLQDLQALHAQPG